MRYLSHIDYTAPSFSTAEITVRGEMSEEIYLKYVARLGALREVAVSSIAYLSDGLKVTGIEVLPHREPGEKLPLIIYNRGGSGDFGGLSAAQIVNLMWPMARDMRAGVLGSNYRGNMGSEGAEEFGGADVRDVLNLIEVGKQQPWWDGKNIFMLGWSRGGMMTYRAIAEGAQLNAAAVGAGITDAVALVAARPEMMAQVIAKRVPGFAEHGDKMLRARSAIYWPEKLTVPLLLLHGDADKKVAVDQARRLYAALRAQGSEVRYVEFSGGSHGLMSDQVQVMREIAAWFTSHRR